MKTETWKAKEGAGFPASVLNAEVVKITSTNLAEVADWCGGTVAKGNQVMVPTRKFIGDPNKRTKSADGKTDVRDLKEFPLVLSAGIGEYVVKWSGRFYVPNPGWFEAAYEKES